MKNTNWKVPVIIAVGVVAIILLIIFGSQSFPNKAIALEAKDIKNFKFVWFTDGIGWKSARGNLRETFEVMEMIYSIDDMENGVMRVIFV